VSYIWWTKDGKLEITSQDLPLESGRRTHLLHCTYSYCILSRVWKLTLHCLFYVTMNIYFCFYFDVVTVLLIFAEYLSLYPHIFKCTYRVSNAHTEAHMHKHTCIISTQGKWRQPCTGALFEGAEERLLLETKALHTQQKGAKKMVRKIRHSRI